MALAKWQLDRDVFVNRSLSVSEYFRRLCQLLAKGIFRIWKCICFCRLENPRLPVLHMLVSCSVSSVPSMWYVYTVLLLKQFY